MRSNRVCSASLCQAHDFGLDIRNILELGGDTYILHTRKAGDINVTNNALGMSFLL